MGTAGGTRSRVPFPSGESVARFCCHFAWFCWEKGIVPSSFVPLNFLPGSIRGFARWVVERLRAGSWFLTGIFFFFFSVHQDRDFAVGCSVFPSPENIGC